MPRGGWTRRDFLKRAAAGVALAAGLAAGETEAIQAGPARGMRYRTLGRTKLKVSQLGLGCAAIRSPAVARRALELGITYFDTASAYGDSERLLGDALKGQRDRAVVATKWIVGPKTTAAELAGWLDSSLKRLQMEYVDIIHVHDARTVGQVESEAAWNAFNEAKQAGKARFNGVSAHQNQAELLQVAIKNGRFDVLTVSYNAFIGEGVAPVIAQAHAAGVGVVAMKALQPIHGANEAELFKGLRGNPYQRAIQWVLRNPALTACIVDMAGFEELEEDYRAAVATPSQAELDEFERAAAAACVGACRLCGACTAQCPAGVEVASAMRALLYAEGYRDRARGAALYQGLDVNGAACGKCATCRVVCPSGVSVQERVTRAHRLLA